MTLPPLRTEIVPWKATAVTKT